VVPVVGGFDERRDAWMDEGFNTFIDVYESDAFANGVYGPKRDPEYAPVAVILSMRSCRSWPIRAPVIRRVPMPFSRSTGTRSPTSNRPWVDPAARADPGAGAFRLGFPPLHPDWAFRHPAPADFFRAMESEGGEDLAGSGALVFQQLDV